MRTFKPPPTSYGLPGTPQAKAESGANRAVFTPPSTRFGPSAPLQAKAAGAIPQTTYGTPQRTAARPAMPTGTPPQRAKPIQRMMQAPPGGGGLPPWKRTGGGAKTVAVKKGPTYSASMNCLGYSIRRLLTSSQYDLVKNLQWAKYSVTIMKWIQDVFYNGAAPTFQLVSGIELQFITESDIANAPNDSIIVGNYEFGSGEQSALYHIDDCDDYVDQYKIFQQDDAHYFYKDHAGLLSSIPFQRAGEHFPISIEPSGIYQLTNDRKMKIDRIMGYIILTMNTLD